MTPSIVKCPLRSGVPPPILAKGRTTIERRGGADFSCAGAGCGLPRKGGRDDLQRIDTDRLGDIL